MKVKNWWFGYSLTYKYLIDLQLSDNKNAASYKLTNGKTQGAWVSFMVEINMHEFDL